jgi:hypothetical protein
MKIAPVDLNGENIPDDAPLLLDVAAAIAFPDGSMTGKRLRREVDGGRLGHERFGRRIYTTLRDIKNMRARCRENPWESASGSESARGVPLSGSSSTDQTKLAQDAAKTTALALIASSKNTSQKSISPSGAGGSRTK